jgi:hypothetical protein
MTTFAPAPPLDGFAPVAADTAFFSGGGGSLPLFMISA